MLRVGVVLLALNSLCLGSSRAVVDTTSNQKTVSQKICNLLLENSLRFDIDSLSTLDQKDQEIALRQSPKSLEKVDVLTKKIKTLVQSNKPIVFTCVGFPFKSGNLDKKVLGILPDMAERQALLRLNALLENITKLHPQGAQLIVFMDGLAFSKLLGIPYEHVDLYEMALKQLASDLPRIKLVSLKDILKEKSLQEIEQEVDRHVDESQTIPVERANLMHERLAKIELDHHKGRECLKNKNLAQQMEQRSDAFSKLISNYRPKGSLSLSVHYKKDVSEKVGIELLPNSLFTPWHGVALRLKDGTYRCILKKKVGHKSRIQYTVVNGISCPYYEDFN